MLVPTGLSPLLLEREHESAVIAAALGSLLSGSGAALCIVGANGIGKSRLAAELARAAAQRGAVVVRTAVEPDGSAGEPFGALEGLARAALAAGASLESDRARLFARARAALGLDAPTGASRRAEPVSPVSGSLTEPVASGGLVLELVEQLCRRRPVVVVWDDLHHGWDETRAAAALLTEAASRLPLLVVSTSVSSSECLPGGTLIEPGPLTDRSVRTLIASCLYGSPIPAALVESVVDHSGGVPLLAEELLAAGGRVRSPPGARSRRPRRARA